MILGITIPTVYMASRIRVAPLRRLSVLLSSFLLLHGIYHLTAFTELAFRAEALEPVREVLIEPLGWALFLAFAIYFAMTGG
jgi:hypothetical protein